MAYHARSGAAGSGGGWKGSGQVEWEWFHGWYASKQEAGRGDEEKGPCNQAMQPWRLARLLTGPE